MSDYLSQEVIEEILSRVPVKSLLRFRCVSKSWRSLISSPSFFTAKANNGQKLLLLRYFSPTTRTEEYSLRFDDSTFHEFAAFKCPFKSGVLHFRVVGICNGLVCLCDEQCRSDSLILWNPAIRKFVNLPKPSIDLPMAAIGFGFNSQNYDFKVVRLACHRERGIATAPMVEVYSMRSGSWRTIANKWDPSYGVVEHLWSHAYSNGAVHWVGYKSADFRKRYHNQYVERANADKFFRVQGYQSSPEDGFHNVVLSLDLADEEFRVIEIPEDLADGFPLNFSLGLCGDSLALFAYDNRLNCESFDVFVMKEYGVVESWSRLFRFSAKCGIWSVFGFKDGGEMLFATADNEMLSFNLSTHGCKNLGTRGVKNSLYASGYVENLALLDEVNDGLFGRIKSCEVTASRSVVEEEKKLDENFEKRLEDCLNMNYLISATSIMGLPLAYFP